MKTTVKYAPLATALLLGSAGMVAAQDAAMIEAAKAEPPITVYAVTGKIVETAEAFTKAYGVQATGKKVNEAEQAELMIREAQAGNIVGDLAVAGDLAVIMGQLIPEGIATTWLPPDLADSIAPQSRDPLVVVSDPHVWAYNTEVHDHCPVDNVWAFTDPDWHGKVAMMDPLAKPAYADWFNQLETHHDAEMAAAYEAHYGKPLDTSAQSATAAWVQAFAANAPLIADSSGVSDAVGALGQAEPFMGIMSTAKFRDNTKGKTALGICSDIAPFEGWLYPGVAAMATGSKSPNATKLFVQYLLSEEGIAPQTIDGKISSNTSIAANPEESSGVGSHIEKLMVYDTATAIEDLDKRQDWQDAWRMALRN